MAGRLNGSAILRIAVLVIALLGFLLPLVCAAIFGFTLPGVGLTLESLSETFADPQALTGIVNTLVLTLVSTVGMLVLLVPTLIAVHLKAPKLASWTESVSVLPMVIPAIALVSGASIVFRATVPTFMTSIFSLVPLYIIIGMPLCYRALDAGVRTLDLRTLFAASSSLGARASTTLFKVVLPNLRVAMLSASLISVAMLLGEYALASLLLHYTFPVFLASAGQDHPRGAAALSFITMMLTWGLLAFIDAAASRQRRAKTRQRLAKAS